MPERFDNQNRSENYERPNYRNTDNLLSQYVAGNERRVREGDKYDYSAISDGAGHADKS